MASLSGYAPQAPEIPAPVPNTVRHPPPTPANISALPSPLEAVNQGLERFIADWEAAGCPDGAVWLSTARFNAMGSLLDQGSATLARSLPRLPVTPESENQRRRYSANLRRLLPLLLHWQQDLADAARRMEEHRAHQRSLRQWLAHQAP